MALPPTIRNMCSHPRRFWIAFKQALSTTTDRLLLRPSAAPKHLPARVGFRARRRIRPATSRAMRMRLPIVTDLVADTSISRCCWEGQTIKLTTPAAIPAATAAVADAVTVKSSEYRTSCASGQVRPATITTSISKIVNSVVAKLEPAMIPRVATSSREKKSFDPSGSLQTVHGNREP